MATIFSDGFESGDFSAWTGTNGSPSVQNGTAHHGLYYMNAQGSMFNGVLWYSGGATYNSLYLRAMVRYNTFPSGASDFILDLCNYNGPTLNNYLVLTFDGTNYWATVEHDSGSSGSALINLSLDTWHTLELFAEIDTGNIIFWFDGVQKINYTAPTPYGDLLRYAMISRWSTSATLDRDVDCIVVSDGYIGPEVSNILFSDGFESGDFSAWTGTRNYGTAFSPSVQSTISHHGTYAANLTKTVGNGGAEIRYIHTESLYYIRFYAYITALPSVSGDALTLVDLGGGTRRFYIYNDAGTIKYCFLAEATTYTFTETPAINTWICFEVAYKVDATTGFAFLAVNDVVKINETDINTGVTGIDVVSLCCGSWGLGAEVATTIFYDCVVVSDGYIGTEVSKVSNRLLMGVGLGCVSSP